MFKGLAGMASLMGNLQHLPAKLDSVNERMRQERVEGQSADGRVTVVMNGLGEVQAISVDPTLVETGNPQPAERPICEATNAAGAAAKRMFGQAIHSMAKEMNLNLPGVESLLARMTGGSGG